MLLAALIMCTLLRALISHSAVYVRTPLSLSLSLSFFPSFLSFFSLLPLPLCSSTFYHFPFFLLHWFCVSTCSVSMHPTFRFMYEFHCWINIVIHLYYKFYYIRLMIGTGYRSRGKILLEQLGWHSSWNAFRPTNIKRARSTNICVRLDQGLTRYIYNLRNKSSISL